MIPTPYLRYVMDGKSFLLKQWWVDADHGLGEWRDIELRQKADSKHLEPPDL